MTWTRATTVTIYTSWRGIVVAFLTPLVLLAIGVVGLTAVGTRPVPVVLTALGLLLLLVALLDMPLHSTFDTDGVHRVCLLRRHTLPWHRIELIQRARGDLRSYVQLRSGPSERKPSGGLVAAMEGIRRYQLTDRIESRSEYDMLRDVVRALGDVEIEVSAVRPAAVTPPTTLYRPGVPNPPPPVDAA